MPALNGVVFDIINCSLFFYESLTVRFFMFSVIRAGVTRAGIIRAGIIRAGVIRAGVM